LKVNFENLESIRGLAAFYILLNHARGWLFAGFTYILQSSPSTEPTFQERLLSGVFSFTRLSREAVIVFFVLSGLSIAYSFSKSNSIPSFYKRRLVRIYPPFLFGIAWALIVFYFTRYLTPEIYSGKWTFSPFPELARSTTFGTIRNILRNVFYDINGVPIAQYWTLQHEILFYCLIPIAALNRKLYYLVSFILFVTGVYFGLNDIVILRFLFEYNFYFMAGYFLYFNIHKIEQYLVRITKIQWIIICCLLFGIILSLNIVIGEQSYVGNLLTIFLSMALILLFNNYKIKIFPFLGKISYSLYTTHLATVLLMLSFYHYIFKLENEPRITNPYFWLIAILPSIAVAVVSYKIAESPTRNWLKKTRKHSN